MNPQNQSNSATVDQNPFVEYVRHGFVLCQIPPGQKHPTYRNWNDSRTAINAGKRAELFKAAGLCHAYSGTCALDIDRFDDAEKALADHGIDLKALFNASDAVRISSGTPNRGKLIYRLDESLPTQMLADGAFELRSATAKGKTVQDVLPPSPHPSGRFYQWQGDWRKLPQIPPELLKFWRSQLAVRETPAAVQKPTSHLPELRDLVLKRDASCSYGAWITVGMVLHHETQGGAEGLALWDEWSRSSSEKYPGFATLESHWKSFGNSQDPLTIDTLRRTDVATVEEFDIVNPPDKLRVLNFGELITLAIPPREYILEPIIRTASTTMIFSQRGVGKSYVSLGIGCAVASGTRFLKWSAPKPQRVLYVDAEMSLADIQRDRLPNIFGDTKFDPEFFRFLSLDIQDKSLPCLSTSEAQQRIEEVLDDTELLILDNLSTLVLRGKENEAESWAPIQEWILSLRRQKMSVLLIHHAGRNNEQRGTSKREDILDTIISLRHPKDYSPSQGLRCEVHFTKSRGIHGSDAEPFEVHFSSDFGPNWTCKNLVETQECKVQQLHKQGLSIREITQATGMSKSTVGRMVVKSRPEDEKLHPSTAGGPS